MKRALVPGNWSVDGSRAVPLHAANDADWRAQADSCAEEGGCSNWGISWAFDPAPAQAEPMTGWHLLAGLIAAAAVISVILIAMTDAGLIVWPAQ